MDFYCMKHRKKHNVNSYDTVTKMNKRTGKKMNFAVATCPVDKKTKMYRVLGKAWFYEVRRANNRRG